MRFPWIIWRHTTLEMWRLLLLTAAVLVTVISFAVTVRLTAEGRLGPLDTLKYMILAMPPMLQYALPFAAGFGATLAYHRMSQDNELTAAAGGGLSHRTLLVPALATGTILAVVIGVLNGRVIPRFLRDMDAMVVQDAPRFVYNTLSAGQTLSVDQMQVYADSVRRLGPSQDGRTSETLYLTGVFALRTDRPGSILEEASARHALVEFAPINAEEEINGRGLTAVTMELRQASVTVAGQGSGANNTARIYWVVPGVFNDDPKFLTNAELRTLPDNPDQMNVIDVRRRDLAVHLAAKEAIGGIDAALRANGRAAFNDEAGRRLVVLASGLRYNPNSGRAELVPPSGRALEVEVTTSGRSTPDAVLRARSAGLRVNIGRDRDSRRLRMQLEMEDVISGAGGGREQLKYGSLLPTPDPLEPLLAMSSRELLDEVERRTEHDRDEFVLRPARELEQRIAKLMREVLSKQHERAASAVACLVMVLTGAVTAMRLGNSLPLTVYLWSFFPALLAVITIAAGQQLTHQGGPAGLIVLWGGVALLAVYAAAAFATVRKH